MPGKDSSGSWAASATGDYYCDANAVGGIWCTEMDIQEANNRAWGSTPHTCDTVWANGYYPSCDRGGCGRYTQKNLPANSYGPGTGFTINTLLPFSVYSSYPVDASGKLTSIITTMTQSGRSITMTHDDSTCAAGYVAKMGTYMGRQVPILSLWGAGGDYMGWLDNGVCAGGQVSAMSHS